MKRLRSHAIGVGRTLQLIAAAALMVPVQGLAGNGDVDSGEVQVDLSQYESVQLRPGQDPDLAVAIALPGGGHRSSNCVVGVLLALEQMRFSSGGRSLLEEIDYFSTVSASGCTAGVYLVALRDHLQAGGTHESFSFAVALSRRPAGNRRGPTVGESLAANYQKVILRKGLVVGLIPGGKDRGDKFQSFLDEELLRGFTFGDMMKARGSGDAPSLPMWIPVSTVDRNAAIFPHAPDVYSSYRLIEYRAGGKTRRFAGNYFDVPMSVALKASMSLPVVIPPTVFKSDMHPNRPYIHLKDGGLADNVGALTALSLLRQDSAVRKVLFVVDVNITKSAPWTDGTRAGGIFKQAFDASRIPIDSQVHRYRKQMVSKDIHRDADGRILCGRTHDGIKVVFLYPELISPEAALEVKGVGTTLKIGSAQQQMLICAGWEMTRRQGLALCGITHDGPKGMIADIGAYEISQAAAPVQAAIETEAPGRNRILRFSRVTSSSRGGARRGRW